MAERQGTYQVWHKNGEIFTRVADVNAGNLLAALVFTMHRKDGSWQDHPRVTTLVGPTRSTDLGDRIVDPDGVVYSIDRTGLGASFREVHVSPEVRETGHLSFASLLAEIRNDTAAGKREDAHLPACYGDVFKQILDIRTEHAPPELGKDNEHEHER